MSDMPIFLVRWRLRRLGYRLYRSHCTCQPACYFIDGPNGHMTGDMTGAEVREKAIPWVKDHIETQIRMGQIADDEDPGWSFARFDKAEAEGRLTYSEPPEET